MNNRDLFLFGRGRVCRGFCGAWLAFTFQCVAQPAGPVGDSAKCSAVASRCASEAIALP